MRPRKVVPSAAAPAGVPGPLLTYQGGPVLESVEVVPIYWGSAWGNADHAALAARLDAFFDFIVTSPVMDLLSEYAIPAMPIRRGKRLTSVRLTNSEPGTATAGGQQVTDDQIQQGLQAWIAKGTVPAVTPNTLYFIYLPPNVTCEGPYGFTSCSEICGYHEHIGGTIFYAVVPYVNCDGCVYPGDFLDTLTEISTHELCEAVTDPGASAWWDTNTSNEIGDVCNQQTARLGGYLIQTEWSNNQNACVFAPSPNWDSQQVNAGGATSGPAAAGDPILSVYGEQRHIVYRDKAGSIWDSWYDGPSATWHLQKINAGGVTSGPAAAGDGFASVYGPQWHVAYRDAGGTVWDSWFDGPGGKWHLQRLNAGGAAAAGDPFASVFDTQWHVIYRDAAGSLWDSWYDGNGGKWHMQKINAGGVTNGPAAAGDAFAFTYEHQWHVIYRDASGNIWDAWYDAPGAKWSLQHINRNGQTAGPVAIGDPYAVVYAEQWHVVYRAGDGGIWDAWHDGPGGTWHLQQINRSGVTAGPAAAGDACVSVFGKQFHVMYRDAVGAIWDSCYDATAAKWHLEHVVPGGPAPAGDLYSCVSGKQLHLAYQAGGGAVWDAWCE